MYYHFFKGFFDTVVGALTLSSPPLYRYPYRNSLEAFRSDWKHIGSDIIAARQHYEGESGEGDNYE